MDKSRFLQLAKKRLFVFVLMSSVLYSALVEHSGAQITEQKLSTRNSSFDISVENLLNRYIEALGGREAIKKISSRIMKGSITAPSYKISGTVEIYAKAPNKQLTEIKAPILGNLRTGFDGATAWEEEGDEIKDAPDFVKREADFYLPLNLKEIYPKIELRDKGKIAGADVYILEAPRGGNPKRWYFNEQTGFLVRTEVRNPEGKILISEDYADYRSVDQVKIPFTIRQLEDDFETVTKLSEVKQNVPIDDAIFSKPGRKNSSALSRTEKNAAAQLKTETLREVTTTLASETMQGRGMAQPGGEKAAQYLADKFKSFGLRPGGDASTFFQNMKLKIQTPLPATEFKVNNDSFKFKTDFALAQPSPPSELKDVRGDLVFIGYGVVSNELKRDDLAGINVKDRIVMVLKGKPENVDDEAWEKAANEKVVFGRLIRKGAAGFVVIFQEDSARFPIAAAYVSNRNVMLAEPVTGPAAAARWSLELLGEKYKLPPSVLISENAAVRIMAGSGNSFNRIRRQAEAGTFVSRDLKSQASILPRIKSENGTSSNVIGVIEGSDEQLKNEAVIFTAHYDAFGIDSEGTIYLGAADNALGVGKLIAMAEVLAQMDPKPRRSIIFIATTGEEYGDLGAEYWLKHPTWQLEKVAADINYDGSILEVWGKLGFILDFGFNHSDLNEIIKSVSAASGIEIIPDPLPGESFFTRSDHYSFVKRGIPSLFLSGGTAENAQNLMERAKKWQATNYHMPTDTVQPDWNWEGARAAAVLGLITGLRVANQNSMPAWKTDSPFNHPRGAYFRFN